MTTTLTWSPMLEQYFGMKHRYPEAILLSRVGDFYEAYGEDAETIARALSIALTSKEAGGGRRVAMAGVPHHALDGYLAKLVLQRRVVALAEQLEAPVPNKLVRRDVVRVVTPGTLLEEHILERSAHNYLAAITAYDDVIALAHADISTGHVSATAFDGESALEDVLAEIARLDPAELVADVPGDVRAALGASLENAQTRIAAPVLAAVGERAREPIDGFSFDAVAGDAPRARRARRVRAARQRPDQRRRDAARAAVLPPSDLLWRSTPTRASTWNHQGAGCERACNPARDDRPDAHGDGVAAARPLGPRAAGRARARSARAPTRSKRCCDDAARRLALQDVLHGCFDLERIAQKVRFRRVLPRDLGSLRRTLALLDPIGDALREPSLPGRRCRRSPPRRRLRGDLPRPRRDAGRRSACDAD